MYVPLFYLYRTSAVFRLSGSATCREKRPVSNVKSVLNLQMTYIIIAHIYEQWDR